MRRSTITCGTSTVAFSTTASMTMRRNSSSTCDWRALVRRRWMSARSSSSVSNSLTPMARSSSSSGSSFSCTSFTVTV